ncbi:MAG: MBL fold metallo-hydrolase [Bacteroidales bacterium]|nr:MBL fold metallo-hydrolase [Bacteroidales bacterium]
MRITTLCENLTYQAGLLAEHGLSLLIEINSKKILFDTGQGNALIHNARILGIDLNDVDDVVISHGHYDHVGGLKTFSEMNGKARVYLKKEALSDKLKGAHKDIGVMFPRVALKKRIVLVKEPVEIEKDVFIMPDIPINNSADTGFSGFITNTGNGFRPDEFEDELYLTMVHNGKISVISGCSHRGISNILLAAKDYFKLPVHMVLGGFHLKGCTEGQYRCVVDSLRQISPDRIGVCHCTGVEKYCDLRRDCGDIVFYNSCGNRIELGS